MQLTIVLFDDRVVSVEIDGNDSLETLKAILEAETSIAAPTQILILDGKALAPSTSLSAQGVQPGDLIMLQKASLPPQRPQTTQTTPSPAAVFLPDGSASDPRAAMSQIASLPPDQLNSLPPEIRQAVSTNDVDAFQNMLRSMHSMRRKAEEEETRLIRLAAEDPFNPEVQKHLEEAIRRKNVMENYETALETSPELFGDVVMLYVDMEVNGVATKAFIDSGAQMTIMSKSMAEQCNLLRLMDTRYQGYAVGVGQQKILGRIHMAPLKAENHHITISITVLESDNMKFLFGLDNLKRHQCSIDLKSNSLRFPNLNLDLPFLSEHQIPKSFNIVQPQEKGDGQGSDKNDTAPINTTTTPHVSIPSSSASALQQKNKNDSAAAAAVPAGWEEKISRLMQLGFPRERCLNALHAANGNEEVAGAMLFSL